MQRQSSSKQWTLISEAVLALLIATIAALAPFTPRADAQVSPSLIRAPWAGGLSSATDPAAVDDRGLTAEQAREAAVAEAEIVEGDVAGEAQALLGSAWAGAWFDRSTAVLHLGVTSRTQAELVERLQVEPNSPVIAPTPVDHSWAELEATQRNWDGRLASLLDRGKIATAIDPERNAVLVMLSESISRSRIGLLKLDAAASGGAVLISPTGLPKIRFSTQENTTSCNKFASGEARCNAPLTAGVTIESEFVGGTSRRCSAGPLVVTSPSNHETFMLTAGHCLGNAGGVGVTWYAYNRAGEKKAIGKTKAYIKDETADIGVVTVNNPGYWTVPGNPPAYPVVAHWNATASPFESTPITGSISPVKGLESCKDGQTTGHSCGTIGNMNVAVEETTGLVEVKGAKAEEGDSGGPWIAASREIVGVYAEGTHVGVIEGGTPAFEPFASEFEQLTKQDKLTFKLLTTGNEKRPASPFFMSEIENSWWAGEGVVQNSFTLAGGTVKCTSTKFEGGSFAGPELGAVELHPIYSGCTYAGLKAEIATTGCNYKVEASSPVKIECESGKSIKISVSAGCTVTIGAQSPSGKATYSTSGTGSATDILITFAVEGIKYSSSGGACGSSGEKGGYAGTATTKGYSNSAHTSQVGIKWEKE